jgi:hypothetical protein
MRVVSYEDEVILGEDGLIPDDIGSSPMKLSSYSYKTVFILEGMRECSSRQRVSLIKVSRKRPTFFS